MDMQRTILWMIFSLSLLFLWDGWQKHNGHPSMFGSTPVKTAQTDAPKPLTNPDGSIPSQALPRPVALPFPARCLPPHRPQPSRN
jgi:YidC/Oxa1 family membrane protein insertase